MASGPLTAGVITLEKTQVPYEVTLPGRAVAYERVDIRPRVEGVISEIAYEPGRPVAVGDLLFRIDNETYAAEVQSAEADLASAKAEFSGAQLTVDRYKQIEGTGISRADLQSAQVTLQQAEASVKTAEAALHKAQLSFEWTEIRSPIAGIPDVAKISVGAIVTSNQTDALTTITRLDPIYVDLEEASVRILQIRDEIDAGRLARSNRLGVRLQLENGTDYSGEGRLVSPSTSVSTTTGTIAMRVAFDNPERKILPGQFLRVTTFLGTREAILVPQGATQRASDGSLIAYFERNGKATKVTLEESGSYQNNWIVTSGVETGDKVIVDNLRNISEGVAVKTVPVAYVDGVIRDIKDNSGTPAINVSGEPAQLPAAGE
ncbi:efflux RND transporter periplasmic adaptor subunit [Cohaesibacter haloalkalitolerans]|uniref:efflux RND transporter periplasmic adaptor subunit n=1 Tax=Cohaesibacter haloalkalitolerans TaxID=1162980 RepID=UPI00196933DE|nr:efflux RND transporter periplasmic adaptor subunit [Cohaesibacter haloalkalitolerans]